MILIKAMEQAIPLSYTMSYFKLSLGLCNENKSLNRKFWWGQMGNQREIHWVSWEELCKPKIEGGIGFKDLALFNDALLAKHVWRPLHNEQSIFYKVFKIILFSKLLDYGSSKVHF